MPFHLHFNNRRQFLKTLGGSLIAHQVYGSTDKIDGDLIYLLNDTHIGEKHPPKGKKGRPEPVQFPPPTLGGVVILP